MTSKEIKAEIDRIEAERREVLLQRADADRKQREFSKQINGLIKKLNEALSKELEDAKRRRPKSDEPSSN